ncbi:hypothetical protein IMSAG025_02077 [Muribaculaceae bacterium]|nr:hypothetical protein IMSAG025_02077 [Muribaculaceae bacterium]
MPVHIKNDDVCINVIVFEVLDDVAVIISGIVLVFTIPVAKSIVRRQRHLTGDERVIFKRLLVVMPVTHEI